MSLCLPRMYCDAQRDRGLPIRLRSTKDSHPFRRSFAKAGRREVNGSSGNESGKEKVSVGSRGHMATDREQGRRMAWPGPRTGSVAGAACTG